MARLRMGRHKCGNQQRNLVFCLSALLLIGILTPHAFSTEQEADEPLIKTDRKLPMLNGHRFVLSTFITDPFISSFVHTATGFGVAPNTDITIYDFEGEPVTTIKGDLAYMLLRMEYRQALNRWLSLWTQVEGMGRMGINPESILSQGLTGVFGFELGGLARLWQNDRFLLSASASYRRSKYFGVDILTFVQRIILEGGIAPDNKITKRVPADRYNAGLHFAYAPSDWVGLMASAKLGTTDSVFVRGESETVLSLTGLASIDLKPGTNIPIGFNLGFQYESYPEGSDDLIKDVRQVLFKIAYTGRREFSVGLEGNHSRAPLRVGDNILSAWSGLITLRYYF
jgi:hypothetical protein